MATAPLKPASELDANQLLRINTELRRLVRLLKTQNKVLLQQNRTYEELHKFDNDAIRELSGNGKRKRRRTIN